MNENSVGYTKSMIFFNGQHINHDENININCYWCRHPFTSKPWFCPLKFYPEKNIFEVDGIFCSPECHNAFLYDNNTNPIYKDSAQLFSLLYFYRVGKWKKKLSIAIAPSWKLLQSYGGDMTIDEYRSTFDTVDIIPTESMERPIQCFPVSWEFSIHQKWGI